MFHYNIPKQVQPLYGSLHDIKVSNQTCRGMGPIAFVLAYDPLHAWFNMIGNLRANEESPGCS
jgi:hypothetical protein